MHITWPGPNLNQNLWRKREGSSIPGRRIKFMTTDLDPHPGQGKTHMGNSLLLSVSNLNLYIKLFHHWLV